MFKNIVILSIMLSFFSCKTYRELSTVENVEIEKYMGQWYEMARLPNRFEKGLSCVTANYSLKENGKIKVVNKGFSSEKNKYSVAQGTAWIPDETYPGRLKVSFFWPFAGNYYIIFLDKEYQYALIGDPSRKYLWVLSRSRALNSEVYEQLLTIAKEEGFAIEKVLMIHQDCE